MTRPDSHNHHGRRDYSEAPLVVTWEVTQACDLACEHCRAEAVPERSGAELDVGEARALFNAVAEFSPTPVLVLSGGDPLKRPDLFELLETAVDVGVRPSITPATTDRLDREAIERFVEVGVGRMALSLDGATADSHDGFRGEEGAYETAIRAAEIARVFDLPVQINTTVTATTVDDLPEISRIVDDLDAVMWEVFFLVPIGRGADLDQLSPERVSEVMEWLYRRSLEVPYRVITVEAPFYRRVANGVACEDGRESPRVGSTGAGNGFVFISHTGEVYPSGFLPLSAGNVHEEPLDEIYRNADLMERLRDPDSLVGPCGSCSFRNKCGGSRSRAYAVTGNPLATDPLCPWTGEVV